MNPHHIQVSVHLAADEPVGSLAPQRLSRPDLYDGRPWFNFTLAGVSVHVDSLDQLENIGRQLLAFVTEQRAENRSLSEQFGLVP